MVNDAPEMPLYFPGRKVDKRTLQVARFSAKWEMFVKGIPTAPLPSATPEGDTARRVVGTASIVGGPRRHLPQHRAPVLGERTPPRQKVGTHLTELARQRDVEQRVREEVADLYEGPH